MWGHDVNKLSARVYICALLCSSSENVKQFKGLIVRVFTFSDPVNHQFYSVKGQIGRAPYSPGGLPLCRRSASSARMRRSISVCIKILHAREGSGASHDKKEGDSLEQDCKAPIYSTIGCCGSRLSGSSGLRGKSRGPAEIGPRRCDGTGNEIYARCEHCRCCLQGQSCTGPDLCELRPYSGR